MEEDSCRLNSPSSGLAAILDSNSLESESQRPYLVSYCNDFGLQSLERTLEYIFGLPHKFLHLPTGLIDADCVCSILKHETVKIRGCLDTACNYRSGRCAIDGDSNRVTIDESSRFGNIDIVKPPLVLESHAKFSSARFNTCVWKGKWMYEVILETAGIQQLGWAPRSCLFTDDVGVGDAEDSYAFDGNRVSKWNRSAKAYGQSWVVGDVIGCCIDMDDDEVSFYRNGHPLGVAFDKVRKMGSGLGYFPAISLSQGERCDVNFGVRPFKYPVNGFLPIQAPPAQISIATYLLKCLSRLLEVQNISKSDESSVVKPRKLKRFVPLDELFHPISYGICKELFSLIDLLPEGAQYISWGPLLSFLMEVFKMQAPHDYESLDKIVDVFLEFPGSHTLFQHVMDALSCNCKTASLVLKDFPYSGSYPFLVLGCHFLRRKELMLLFWRSSDFEYLLEGFLSRKSPNKQDLECLMPSVWWPGLCEDISSESSMILTTTVLSEAIEKIEELHRELCRLVIQFVPPTTPLQLPGMVFRTFLQNLILKSRVGDHDMPTSSLSGYSVLVSLYTVILYFLSEGFGMRDTFGWTKGLTSESGLDESFLHRGGQQSFPISLFVRNDPHRTNISRLGGSFEHLLESHPVNNKVSDVVQWEEGCMDAEGMKITHSTRQKPCCCLDSYLDFARILKIPVRNVCKGSRGSSCPIPEERSNHVAAECSAGSLNDEIGYKPGSSEHSESDFGYQTLQSRRSLLIESHLTSTSLREEELLDAMLYLYYLGLVPNFKQASYYMSHQSHILSLLDETEKQIRERSCVEQMKRLKEARTVYREELIDCIRRCAWYRVSLFSHWKQRGMYAACMWVVQLLLVLSKMDSLFIYVPEFYVESLVDSFHALRKSDPPFVSSAIFIKQGLNSFVTFLAMHFIDPRISSAALRDLLLQSIQVLVQYKDYLIAFECNEVAIQQMPRSLLCAFDNRSWIPVTNIILRLCKASRFVSLKHGESSSITLFQDGLREACINDECLFSAFLNRLFNTLSWTMTEFSVSIREMQGKYPVLDMQQRKCSVIFDLSCNLAGVLEFCTCEIPQAFLLGPGINLQRLTELIIFILNHVMMMGDSEFYDLTFRRQGQSAEKISRGMILAPLTGIILNLLDASVKQEKENDLLQVLAGMECPATINSGFQYLLDYNWKGILRAGDASVARLWQLEKFLSCLRSKMLSAEHSDTVQDTEEEESSCCICYACNADARFVPCHHMSCFECITRHLLNSTRCFFCNASVQNVVKVSSERLEHQVSAVGRG